ncbi:hypothetical protein SAMN05444397_104194 [Flavobacterium aquidurense]|uniref:DUF4142 domain-containing protein n=1 Tax=Flavobacterium frigidimaris TaxID=262320 RepID=A0ABX4BS35_FLAFR|nr:hypothetical protein [Flavobacterium frigidimaris]OXA79536.1 hypothetical protein B0A65_09185 [Flavobacterium frigidimaris]SDZ21560.1 hypothetical protein SAMN05444397_104194 [Flavobacterium aquidurense]
MKKYISGLLFFCATITIKAQEIKIHNSDDVYKYTDLTTKQVSAIRLIEKQWQENLNYKKSKQAYLVAAVQQQTAIDSILKPTQQKQYHQYTMMKAITDEMKQIVSLSKQQENKIAKTCFSSYAKMDKLFTNSALNDDDKKTQYTQLSTQLSENVKAFLTSDQRKQLDAANESSFIKVNKSNQL